MKWLNADGILRKVLSSFAGVKPGRLILWLVLGIGALALVGDVRGTIDAHLAAKLAEERSKVVLQINEITQARFAKHRADKDSLGNALQAARQMNGQLVAALAIRTRPDTVFVPLDTVPTETIETPEGTTRLASLSDTTDMGIEITVKAEAPPEPAALRLGYTLFVPEFRPEIAFIETPEGIFASVSWANQDFIVEAPFFRPPQKQKPLRINAGAFALLHNTTEINNLLFASIYGEIEYFTSPRTSITVPLGVSTQGPYLGLGLKRNLGEWDGLLDFLNPF